MSPPGARPTVAERGRWFRRRVVARLAVAAWLASACQTPVVHPAEPGLLARSELEFLRDGGVTRADVLLELGEPAAAFENERVLFYQLERRPDGSLRTRVPLTRPREPAAWNLSLVLVFGEDDVLERHSVVVAE